MRLILIRHGETTWNAQGKLQGWVDIPLTPAGRAQADALARMLACERIDALVTSDLRQAQETAGRIAEPLGLAVRTDPRWRELNFGAWEGKTYAELEQHDAQTFAAWQSDPVTVAPPGGETVARLAGRVDQAVADLRRCHPAGTVVVVTHGGPIRVLLCQVLGVDLRHHHRWAIGPGSLTDIVLGPHGPEVLRVNVAPPTPAVSTPPAAAGVPLHDTRSRLHPVAGNEPAPPDAGLILVLGGARSGKSRFAQRLAARLGGDRVLFVATAEARDAEMARRIAAHRAERPAAWRTVEAPRHTAARIRDELGDARAVLLDCFTLLVSNAMLDSLGAGHGGRSSQGIDAPPGGRAEELPEAAGVAAEQAVVDEVDALLAVAAEIRRPLIVVSNEVGWGLVPPTPVGRLYRDLLGRAHQILARHAAAVYLVVAGIPIPVRE